MGVFYFVQYLHPSYKASHHINKVSHHINYISKDIITSFVVDKKMLTQKFKYHD